MSLKKKIMYAIYHLIWVKPYLSVRERKEESFRWANIKTLEQTERYIKNRMVIAYMSGRKEAGDELKDIHTDIINLIQLAVVNKDG